MCYLGNNIVAFFIFTDRHFALKISIFILGKRQFSTPVAMKIKARTNILDKKLAISPDIARNCITNETFAENDCDDKQKALSNVKTLNITEKNKLAPKSLAEIPAISPMSLSSPLIQHDLKLENVLSIDQKQEQTERNAPSSVSEQTTVLEFDVTQHNFTEKTILEQGQSEVCEGNIEKHKTSFKEASITNAFVDSAESCANVTVHEKRSSEQNVTITLENEHTKEILKEEEPVYDEEMTLNSKNVAINECVSNFSKLKIDNRAKKLDSMQVDNKKNCVKRPQSSVQDNSSKLLPSKIKAPVLVKTKQSANPTVVSLSNRKSLLPPKMAKGIGVSSINSNKCEARKINQQLDVRYKDLASKECQQKSIVPLNSKMKLINGNLRAEAKHTQEKTAKNASSSLGAVANLGAKPKQASIKPRTAQSTGLRQPDNKSLILQMYKPGLSSVTSQKINAASMDSCVVSSSLKTAAVSQNNSVASPTAKDKCVAQSPKPVASRPSRLRPPKINSGIPRPKPL